ncbi:hypothetical protein PR048_029680 [Dryococelus australis]|uniref:Uncharacterized protein n=1 Tax=Dryococelus australis TaxID=614101 RepID=A0ABQ9GG11_9NEOP|nr:hypothetical protein PR048_029680 [Dryococelus australis]
MLCLGTRIVLGHRLSWDTDCLGTQIVLGHGLSWDTEGWDSAMKSEALAEGGGNERTLRKPAEHWHRPARFLRTKIREGPRWESNPVRLRGRRVVCSLTTTSPLGVWCRGAALPLTSRLSAQQGRKSPVQQSSADWYRRGGPPTPKSLPLTGSGPVVSHRPVSTSALAAHSSPVTHTSRVGYCTKRPLLSLSPRSVSGLSRMQFCGGRGNALPFYWRVLPEKRLLHLCIVSYSVAVDRMLAIGGYRISGVLAHIRFPIGMVTVSRVLGACLRVNHTRTVLKLPDFDWPVRQENIVSQRHAASKEKKSAETSVGRRFPHWLLHRCKVTPSCTGLHVIGLHNCEGLIYWRRAAQDVSYKVSTNDVPLPLPLLIYIAPPEGRRRDFCVPRTRAEHVVRIPQQESFLSRPPREVCTDGRAIILFDRTSHRKRPLLDCKPFSTFLPLQQYWGCGGVVDRLLASHPTKAIRLRFPAGSPSDFGTSDSSWTMMLVGGFSQGSSFSLALAFRRCSILNSLHPHRISRPRCSEPPKKLSTPFGKYLHVCVTFAIGRDMLNSLRVVCVPLIMEGRECRPACRTADVMLPNCWSLFVFRMLSYQSSIQTDALLMPDEKVDLSLKHTGIFLVQEGVHFSCSTGEQGGKHPLVFKFHPIVKSKRENNAQKSETRRVSRESPLTLQEGARLFSSVVTAAENGRARAATRVRITCRKNYGVYSASSFTWFSLPPATSIRDSPPLHCLP